MLELKGKMSYCREKLDGKLEEGSLTGKQMEQSGAGKQTLGATETGEAEKVSGV